MRPCKTYDQLYAFLFLTPALLPLLLFWIYPILASFFTSFTNWDYMTSEFQMVGFSNFKTLLTDAGFHSALKNTLAFTVGTVCSSILLGGALALLIHSMGKSGTIYKLLLFSPWITPTVAISIVWTWILEPDTGFANQIFEWLGLLPLPWLHSSSTAMLSVILVSVWKNLGYVMLLFLTAFVKLPTELYDAAGTDGASPWKKLIHITIPLISPTTFLVFIMITSQALQAYDQIQILTQGGPSGSTRTLLYLYYQLAFQQFRMGEACAVAVLLVLISLSLSLVHYWFGRRRVYNEHTL